MNSLFANQLTVAIVVSIYWSTLISILAVHGRSWASLAISFPPGLLIIGIVLNEFLLPVGTIITVLIHGILACIMVKDWLFKK